MLAGKTDHAYKMQLAPFGVFIRDAVEELKQQMKSTPPCTPPAPMAGNIYGSYTDGWIERIPFYPAQVQTRAKRPDDVVGEIGLLRVPHEPDGDDLRTVQKHPANLDALTTVALQTREKRARERMGGENF